MYFIYLNNYQKTDLIVRLIMYLIYQTYDLIKLKILF